MTKGTDNLTAARKELEQGACGGVFIDDTGSPGLADTPRHLHPARKSWIAAIVPKHQMKEVMTEFPKALAELTAQCGATEFHFVDIYQGTKQFKGVELDLRMALFAFMSHIFATYGIPVLVQTLDPDKKAVAYFRERFPQRVGPLDLHKHEDLALLLLLIRAKWLIRDELGSQTVRLFVDEGRFKAGSVQSIPRLDPPFIKGEILSASSEELHPIQLADFAAFALNRMQLLLGRQDLNHRDKQLLATLKPMAENFRNIEVRPVHAGVWPPMTEDKLIALVNRFEDTGEDE
ncbi:MAG: hypothetical protein RLO50_11115 [Azospirillaceae bacterium]